MQTSQQTPSSRATIDRSYQQPQQTASRFEILNNNACPETVGNRHQAASAVSIQSFNEQFFTLESTPATEFPTPSGLLVSSNTRCAFSPQGSTQSCLSNQHHSPDNTYGSPISGSSFVNSSNEDQVLRVRKVELLGPGSDFEDGSITSSFDNRNSHHKLLQTGVSNLDLKQILIACAHAIDDGAKEKFEGLMEVLKSKVSVSGEPIQRLGAYMLEGLRARQLSSGSVIYKKLRCIEPTGKELMSYMSLLYEICPYYKFAYATANVLIKEAVEYETHVHVIDFLIAQGSQWVQLIEDLANRPGGPPKLRVTGVDDDDSSYARGGGLHLVGQRLAKVAESHGVPFEFHAAAISGSEVEWGNLKVQPGEVLAVNFPYMLHHMPDESVSTTNHRDRLIRLVKSLSPKVVTLLEQESNTNTASFFRRFEEAFDYYMAMFESIDAGRRPRNDPQRISAEEHCVAKDLVNIIACEDRDRVERHEPLDKWKFRLKAAGFSPCPLSHSAVTIAREVLSHYSGHYWLGERDGALILGWKNRAMATSSAWR